MTERKNGRFVGKEDHAPGDGDWSRSGRRSEPENAALDRILAGLSFPASKEAVTRQLALEAFSHDATRAAELHDLVVQLEARDFRDLEELHRAIRERHAWEKIHESLI